jgi:hypothetical protein
MMAKQLQYGNMGYRDFKKEMNDKYKNLNPVFPARTVLDYIKKSSTDSYDDVAESAVTVGSYSQNLKKKRSANGSKISSMNSQIILEDSPFRLEEEEPINIDDNTKIFTKSVNSNPNKEFLNKKIELFTKILKNFSPSYSNSTASSNSSFSPSSPSSSNSSFSPSPSSPSPSNSSFSPSSPSNSLSPLISNSVSFRKSPDDSSFQISFFKKRKYNLDENLKKLINISLGVNNANDDFDELRTELKKLNDNQNTGSNAIANNGSNTIANTGSNTIANTGSNTIANTGSNTIANTGENSYVVQVQFDNETLIPKTVDIFETSKYTEANKTNVNDLISIKTFIKDQIKNKKKGTIIKGSTTTMSFYYKGDETEASKLNFEHPIF